MKSIRKGDFPGRENARSSRSVRVAAACAWGIVFFVIAGSWLGVVPRTALKVASAQSADAAQRRDFDEARSYITSGEWSKAEAAFIRFIDAHPRGKMDAALYWLAFSMKKQDKLQQADQVLARLARDFPRSLWSDDARSMRLEIAAQVGNSEMIDGAAQDSVNDEAKLIALQTLARQEPEKAISILMDILKPNSTAGKGTKEAAINLLAQSGASQAAPVLAQMARDETDLDLRKGAIRALGRVGGDSELVLLEDLTRREGTNEVGEAAIFALAHHKNPRTIEFLSQLAAATESAKVRQRIILLLGTRDGSAGLDALSRIFIAVPDFETRREIVVSMFRHGDRSGSGEAKSRLLEIARSSNNSEVRQEAIMWISRLRDARAVDDLSQLYSEEQNEALKESIIGALGRTFGQSEEQRERAQKKLKEIAEGDASEVLRTRAAFWLRQSQSGAGGPVSGFPGSLGPTAKAPGALNLPVPDVVSSAPSSPKRGFIEVAGNNFKDRLDAGIIRGRSGTSQRFWLGYSFDVRRGRAYKANVANPDSTGGGTMSFDGPVQPGSALETRNLAVFLLYRAGTGAVEQVELLNLDRQQYYEGHPVFWLGRAETEESLNLLAHLVASDQSSRLSDKAITAVALHNPSGRAAKEDQAGSILTAIASNHPVKATRQLALNWLRQIKDERAHDFINGRQ